MAKTAPILAIFGALAAALLLLGLFQTPEARAAASAAITGYAWSDTIGWVSLNCSDGGPSGGSICGASNYGLTVNGDGSITGYAWSDNIGWIQAYTSSSGCPQAPCAAKLASNQMQGWLRALAQDGNGWDGWISLKGSSPSYGVTQSGNGLSGYAWGSDVIGWLDFSYAQTTFDDSCEPETAYSCPDTNTIVETATSSACVVTVTNPYATCSAPNFCTAGSAACITPAVTGGEDGGLTVVPSLVMSGETTEVSWDTDNATSCSVEGSNGDSWSATSSTRTSSAITGLTTYTLSCDGGDEDLLEDDLTDTDEVNLIPIFQEL